jgi:hypothetical protein
MKIAFFGDVHLGNHKRAGGEILAGLNARCLQSLRAFRKAITLCIDQGCKIAVITGDLFDYDRPEAQLITKVQEILASIPPDFVIYCMVGNHDQRSELIGDHALGPISGLVQVIDQPYSTLITVDTVNGKPFNAVLDIIPFTSKPAIDALQEYQVARSKSPYPANLPRVLAMHFGLQTKDITPPWLLDAKDGVNVERVLLPMCQKYNIAAVFAGHYHSGGQHTIPDSLPIATQCGALVPTGWDNPGAGYGNVWILDIQGEGIDATLHRVPGPRFLSDMDDVRLCNEDDNIYLSVIGENQDSIRDMVSTGKLAYGEVLPAVSKTKLQDGLNKTKGLVTIDIAIKDFIERWYGDTTTLPPGITKEAITSRVRKYLAGAQS